MTLVKAKISDFRLAFVLKMVFVLFYAQKNGCRNITDNHNEDIPDSLCRFWVLGITDSKFIIANAPKNVLFITVVHYLHALISNVFMYKVPKESMRK